MNSEPKHIVLVSCVKKKQAQPVAAKDMYVSPLFRKMLAYAMKQKPDKIFILSAKYGLLELARVIESYEKTLNSMKDTDIRCWAERVLEQLRRKVDLKRDQFTILASQKYRKHLVGHFEHCIVPMQGLRIGEQLAFLTQELGK